MCAVVLSASLLKQQVETKAYAYGVSPTVSSLLGEFVVALLRKAQTNNSLTISPYDRKTRQPN